MLTSGCSAGEPAVIRRQDMDGISLLSGATKGMRCIIKRGPSHVRPSTIDVPFTAQDARVIFAPETRPLLTMSCTAHQLRITSLPAAGRSRLQRTLRLRPGQQVWAAYCQSLLIFTLLQFTGSSRARL